MTIDPELISSILGPQKDRLLRCIGEESDKLGLKTYLVGGAVRDLMLGRCCDDIDVVVEGDANLLVDALYGCWGKGRHRTIFVGKPIKFQKFGTAKLPLTLKGADELSNIDFASARREVYPSSGAQPIVTFSDISDDLSRRDFSINALAMVLNQTNFAKVIDNFNGIQHLYQKLLMVLHAKSFEDDPARLIRAIRYSVRLGFILEEATATAFNLAIKEQYLQRLPRFRLFDEFKKLLTEPLWQSMIKKMFDCGLLIQVSALFSKLKPELLNVTLDDWTDRLGYLYQGEEYQDSYNNLLSFGLSARVVSQILKK